MGTMVEKFETDNESKRKYGSVETPLSQMSHITEYLKRIGAEWVGLTKATIRIEDGQYFRQIGAVRFNAMAQSVSAFPNDLEPTDDELKYIKDELSRVKLPNSVPFNIKAKMPEKFENAKLQANATIYPFKDRNGEVLMYIVRVDNDDGKKTFFPYTCWDDGVVRNQEPEGKLPLFGLENIFKNCRLFIHEGMKAANHWQDNGKTHKEKEDLAKHPYFDYLNTGIHVGWHGGATNPSETDWQILKKLGVGEVIIIADNDNVGKEAAYKISRLCGLKAKLLQFTDDFPQAFDLADELPIKFFNHGQNIKFNGPQIKDMLHPATWASHAIYTKESKTQYLPNPNFVSEWVYVNTPQIYIHKDFPNRHLNLHQYTALIRRFSDDTHVSDILLKHRKAEVQNLAYDPSQKTGIVTKSGDIAFNAFSPTKVEPTASDYQPFLDFLSYLIADDHDRIQVMTWCATLIAKPEIRMGYSMLLISETQGIGKTTLAESILAPLVGEHNVSFPNEQMINGQFNSWAGFKRLAIVSEIHQGQGWKAYNQLKSTITDRYIELNEKHKAAITLENWIHIVASSNSMDALKIDNEDRRWLIPKLTDAKWKHAKFRTFHEWLDEGGLSSIYGWAESYGDYVLRGEEAPKTSTKNEIIRSSRSPFIQEAISLVECSLNHPSPKIIVLSHLICHAKMIENEKCFDKPRTFKRALQDEGWITFGNRLSVNGKNEYILLNYQAASALKGLDDDASKSLVREWTISAKIDYHGPAI